MLKEKLQKIKNALFNILRVLRYPLLTTGFLLVFVWAYYPFSVNIADHAALRPPSHSFLMFWVWREWASSIMLNSYLSAEPFNLWHFVYYGILSNGQMPETGSILDILTLSIPLRSFLNLPFPLYFNVKFIIILLFNSLAGYYAVKKLTQREDAGIISGVFMAVNPSLIIALNKARLRMGILGFAILCLYFFYETVKEPRWKPALLCGLFLGLTSLFYAFYGMILIAVMLLVVFVRIIESLIKKQKKELLSLVKFAGVSAGVFLLIILPWMIPYLGSIEIKGDETRIFGVSLRQDIPVPDVVFSNEYRESVRGTEKEFHALILSQQLPLFMYFPLFYALFALIPLLKPKPWTILLFLLSILLFVLSLGPYLKTEDLENLQGFYLSVQNEYIVMPYLYFYRYIPLFPRLHHPEHLLSISAVALMLLAGYGFAYTFNFLDGKKLKPISIIILLAVSFYLITGVKNYPRRTNYSVCRVAEIPQFYHKLAQEPFCGIIEVPFASAHFSLHNYYDRIDFYQALHSKKIIPYRYYNAAAHFEPSKKLQSIFHDDYHEIKRNGNHFMDYLEKCHEGADPEYSKEDVKRIKDAGYKYILIHEGFFKEYLQSFLPHPHIRKLKKSEMEAKENQHYHYDKVIEHFDNSELFEKEGEYEEYNFAFISPAARHINKDKIMVYRIKSVE